MQRPACRSVLCGGIIYRICLGDYVDADGVGHDFLLRNGVFTNIAYPGGASAGSLTINARGDLAGSLGDADGSHGFVFSDGC
jgi:hypothetical protein